jgi:hypothetical protein
MKDETDVHSRLMLAYREVPQWWYATLGLIAFALGIVTIEVWDTKVSEGVQRERHGDGTDYRVVCSSRFGRT